MMKFWFGIAVVMLFVTASAAAQTADEIVAKHIAALGGADKIAAIKTLRTTGKMKAGSVELAVASEQKRPNLIRQEATIQGLTQVQAYDGKAGWQISPFEGKKDPETMGGDDLKQFIDQADFDDPLVNSKARNIKVELVGKDKVSGSDAFKLKVTRPSGTVEYHYLDAEQYVTLKVESKAVVRGAEVESETILGDYKEVNGVYFPFSIETGSKNSQNKLKATLDKIEANVAIDDSRFARPVVKPAAQPSKTEEDKQIPKTPDKKPATDNSKPATTGKPPRR